MGYVLDETSDVGLYQSIYGFRTGIKGQNILPENADTCDLQATLENPFQFNIDWRIRWVKTKVPKVTKKGRKYFYYKSVPVPYPYYQFKKERRSVRQWRLIYQAGIKVISSTDMKIDQVALRLKRLEKFLKDKGKCKTMDPRSASRQHDCVAELSEMHNELPEAYVYNTFTTQEDTEFTATQSTFALPGYHYRFWEPGGTVGFVGPNYTAADTNAQQAFKGQLTTGLRSYPLSIVFNDATVSTVTAMLWPDSGDFEDIQSKPLIDISEAVSDGTFPLGPPPDAVEAHDRMLDHIISDSNLAAARSVVDFSANLWLWDILVVEPLISSAAGLMASVQANDDAIDAYTKQAKAGNWIQGKKIRLFENVANCPNHEVDLEYSETESNYVNDINYRGRTMSVNVDVKKAEGNGYLVYKLSEFDAAQMNTSGARISQFFQRMSSNFDEVLHNVIPLSFVYDWFTSTYTGMLDLENKVYMPVSEWKVVMSYSLDAYLQMTGTAHCNYTEIEKMRYSSSRGWYTVDWLVMTERYNSWYSGGYRYYPRHQREAVLDMKSTERHKYYVRQVYDNPVRRTDFSGGLGIDCFDYLKDDPINTGKAVTLGALIWGMLPG